MSKIEWDKKTGGVVLKRHVTKSTISVSPRPVFFEELDLLHLKEKGWSYPECKEPLLWACNKVYYYRVRAYVKDTNGVKRVGPTTETKAARAETPADDAARKKAEAKKKAREVAVEVDI